MTQPSDSISRTFARWSVGLTYDDLPPAVVDKVKAFTLMAVVAGLIGVDDHHARAIADLVKAEQPKADGATIFGDGAKVTRGAAALANCEVMHSAGLFDSYRMLTHPGPVLVAVALTNAELGDNCAKDVITALAIGYEVHCRLAHDFIPAIGAQGFRPAPLLATVGAAMVAAKLMNLDEDATVAAIAVAVNSCSGLFEGGRSGGGEMSLHSANAARQGTFAAVMASLKQFAGSEHVIEGPSGFYRAYAGRTGPTLTRVFDGPREVDLATVTDDLGSSFRLLDVMFRMYFTAGYNQPVIDVIAELMAEHSIEADAVAAIVVSMNYYETRYPSPEFPRYPDATVPRPGSTQYFAAHAAVHGGYPVPGAAKALDLARDPAVRAMMDRVTLHGVYDHPLFSPNVLIRLVDGRAVVADYPYRRMVWDYERLAVELRRCVDGIPGGQVKLDQVVATVRTMDGLESVAPLFALADRV